jgi:hypothetical protein
MTKTVLIAALALSAIPTLAHAETAVIEATVTRCRPTSSSATGTIVGRSPPTPHNMAGGSPTGAAAPRPHRTCSGAGATKRVAALTLDVAADRSATSASATNPDGSFEVTIGRKGKTGAALWFEVVIDRNRAGRFKLRSARAIQPGKRQVIGAFRQASGELLEVSVTLRP